MPNSIKGQDRANLLLENIISSNKEQGSFLFHGPSGAGKFSKALVFAMAINCTGEGERPCRICNSCKKFLALSHPDFTYIFPTPNLKFQTDGSVGESKYLKEYSSFLQNKIETPYKRFFFSAGTLIRIDAVHMLFHRLNMSVSESRYKVCIIEDVHKMNQNAANAFLKILEEPPKDCVIILLTDQKESLLPTLISRCRSIPFVKLSWRVIAEILRKNYAVENGKAELYAKIADGDMARGIRLAKGYGLELRELAKKLLQAITTGDDITISQMVMEFGKPSFKNEMLVVLHHLSSFFLDIYKLSIGVDAIANFDYQESLQEIASRNAKLTANLLDLVEYLDEVLKYSNLNFSLLLMSVYARYLGNRISCKGV